ncbi:MAG: hypothetical protein Fur0022_05100 [Anaerolineales bacterium]
MGLYFLDTSALVKYYVSEPGTRWVVELLDARTADNQQFLHYIFITTTTLTEVSTALSILWRRKLITRRHLEGGYARFLSDVDKRLFLLHLSVTDFYFAGKLAQKHPLKAYDAIQLAAALRYNEALVSHGFFTYLCKWRQNITDCRQGRRFADGQPFRSSLPRRSFQK